MPQNCRSSSDHLVLSPKTSMLRLCSRNKHVYRLFFGDLLPVVMVTLFNCKTWWELNNANGLNVNIHSQIVKGWQIISL